MDLDKEIAFFEEFVRTHGDSDVLGEGAYKRLRALFVDRVRPLPGESCLDLACGTGAFTRRLEGFGLDVVGIDVSARSVQRARTNAPSARYLIADIRRAPLPERSADIVVYSGVLHHCSTSEARLDVLREGHRLLRPGGRLFAYDPSAHSPSMWLYRDPRSPVRSRGAKTENEVLLRRDDLASELAAAGFAGVRIAGTSGMSFRYVDELLARAILPFYNLYERLLRGSPLEDRLGTFLVTSALRPA